LLPSFAIDLGNGFGQRDVFGAGLDTVLSVGTFLDAAMSEESLQAFPSVHGTGGMHVEEANLTDDGRADEIVVGVHLRAYLETRTARDATGQRVTLFLDLRGDARAFAEIVGAVDGDPSFDALEGFEHELAIDGEVANDGKLGHRLDTNGLFELIDQSGAGHANLAIDNHRAGTADFLEAIGFVRDRSGLFAVASHGILGDVAKTDDDIHGRTPVEGELFPVRGLVGRLLAFDFNADGFVGHRTSEENCYQSFVIRKLDELRDLEKQKQEFSGARAQSCSNVDVGPIGATPKERINSRTATPKNRSKDHPPKKQRENP
jgi:hypothetical protein